jgi:hypothetical protein
MTELVLTYDDVPAYVVSIMQFREGLVAKLTKRNISAIGSTLCPRMRILLSAWAKSRHSKMLGTRLTLI